MKKAEQQEVKGLEMKQEASLRIQRALQGWSPRIQSPCYVNEPLYGSLDYKTPLTILLLNAADQLGLDPTGNESSVIDKTDLANIQVLSALSQISYMRGTVTVAHLVRSCQYGSCTAPPNAEALKAIGNSLLP